jgi:hypothetical protein
MRIVSLAQLNELLQKPNGMIADHSEMHMNKLIGIAKQLQNYLCITLKEKFELKFIGQDRSDYAQIEIPASMLKDSTTKWVEIRLSNMVPLVAISDEIKVSEACLEKIKCALEKAGCIVVDQSIFFSGGKIPLDSSNAHDLDNAWYSLFDFD